MACVERSLYTKPDTFFNRAYAVTHTRIETPGYNRTWQYIAWPFVELIRFVARTKVIGNLPTEGAAFLILNHVSYLDPPLVQGIGVFRALRSIAQIAKRKLVDPKAEESEETQSRRTQKSMEHKKYDELNIFQKAILQAGAYFQRQFGPIPMDPGGADARALFTRVVSDLKANLMDSIFYQGTRMPALDLIDAKEGAAFLISVILPKNGLEDVSLYPIGISGTQKFFGPVEIRIGQPFRLSDIPYEKGVKRRDSVMDFVIDRVAELVTDPSLKPCWRLSRGWGLTKEDLMGIYKRNHDMDSAAWLIEYAAKRSAKPLSREEVIGALELMDSVTFYN